MKIENTVEVDAPLDRVWALVNDIPRVAPCMPGAALTGVGDNDTYEGTVAVKLGPLRMSYKGKVVVESVDEANHSARLAASGRDTKGAGTARAAVETRLEPVDPTRTRLHVTSDVQLTGKVASFGRGGAINDVASRLFGQFAECLRATLEAEPAAGAATAVPGGGGTAAPADGGTTTATDGSAAATPTPATTAAPTGAGGTAAETTPGATEAGTTPSTGTGATPSTGSGATPSTGSGATPSTGTGAAPSTGTEAAPSTGAGAAPSTGAAPGPTSGTGAAGDGTTTAGAGGPAPAVPPSSPRAPAPQPVEALDAGSLVGTVIRGRIRALFQAIAGFFRRLFGRGSTG